MKKIGKHDESSNSSSFSYLPDEIVLQILSRLVDLKTLCHCKLFSIHFNHIVQQVNAISFTIIRVDHASINSNSSGAPSERDPSVNLFKCEPFMSVMKSLQTFSLLKSLCIEIPSFHESADNGFLFKWKLFDNSSDSFLFLSPNLVCDMKENVQDEEEKEEDVEVSKMKLRIAGGCVVDALFIRYKMLQYMKCFPLLENVTITDAGKRGRVSLCGGNIADRENYLRSVLKIIDLWISDNNCNWLRRCYVPLLKLPVSGYMMKGVTLALFEMNDFLDDDSFTNINLKDFEDKEEAVYSEVVMEIFKKNKEWIFG
ncbi:F-box domain containing protein [Tanacetum coccineum]